MHRKSSDLILCVLSITFPNLIKKKYVLSGELDQIEEDGTSEQSTGKSAPE